MTKQIWSLFRAHLFAVGLVHSYLGIGTKHYLYIFTGSTAEATQPVNTENV